MTKIDELTQHHSELRSELTQVEARLARMNLADHIAALEAEVDEATRAGDDAAIDSAVQRLQEARAGSDGFGIERDRLQARGRVLRNQVQEAAQAIEAEKRADRRLRLDVADDLVAEARAEYERQARELVKSYAKLRARAMLVYGLRPLPAHGEALVMPPAFPAINQPIILPLAGHIGLPAGLDGSPAYWVETFKDAEGEANDAYHAKLAEAIMDADREAEAAA